MSAPPTPQLGELAARVALLEALIERLIRVETRLVILMREHGIDPNGKPLDV